MNTVTKLTDESLELLRAVLNALTDASWLVNVHAQILATNSTTNENHLPILNCGQMQIDLTELILSALANNETIELPNLQRHNAKPPKQVNLRVTPILPGKTQSPIALIQLTDASRSNELSLQNAANEKMNSLTGLAAKIAHELNNPLDGSMRYIKLARRRLEQNQNTEPPTKIGEYLSSAQEALGKINGILSDLTLFARQGQSNLETIAVSDLIEQAVRTLSARASLSHVNIITSISENLPRVGGTKLYQVFCNLLKNAIDAIVEKQRASTQSSGQIIITTKVTSAVVKITFTDDGVGLPKECKYLFDAFFSTKAPGEGTGLGLAISKEIIEQYHGTLSAETNPKGGATFTIELPILDETKNAKPITNKKESE